MPKPTSTSTHIPAGSGGELTFWLLLLLGFAALAPCLLLPEWREYQAIVVAEQVEQSRADAMETLVREKRRLLDTIQQDPSVAVRLAQRELHYERADRYPVRVAGTRQEVALPMASTDVLPAIEPETPITIVTPELPVWAARWSDLLPPYNYDGVFCDRAVRPIIMTMSIALIALSFVLYGRRRTAAEL